MQIKNDLQPEHCIHILRKYACMHNFPNNIRLLILCVCRFSVHFCLASLTKFNQTEHLSSIQFLFVSKLFYTYWTFLTNIKIWHQ